MIAYYDGHVGNHGDQENNDGPSNPGTGVGWSEGATTGNRSLVVYERMASQDEQSCPTVKFSGFSCWSATPSAI